MHIIIPKKYYFINSFKKNNIDNLENKIGIIYRNYSDKLNLKEIINIKNYCKKKKLKFYLANNFKVALKLDLDGVYLPSFNNDFKHLNFDLKKSFKILGSAHDIKEIRIKEKQRVELIFLSSIFKKNKNYLGIYKFKLLQKMTSHKIISLGGISQLNEKKINLINCYGIAGISYFE